MDINTGNSNKNPLSERRIKINGHLNNFFPTVIANLICNYDYYLQGESDIIFAETNAVYCVSVLPNSYSYKIVVGLSDYLIKILDPLTKQIVDLYGHHSRINCISVLSDLCQIASGSDGSFIRIWNLQTKQCVHVYDLCGLGISCMTIPKSNNIFVGLNHDDQITKIDVETGKIIKLYGHCGQINCLQCLYTKIDVETGKLIKLYEHCGQINCLDTFPDRCRIVSGSADCTLKIWNSETGFYILTLIGHHASVSCVATLSNERLVSGSLDNTLKIWKLTADQSEAKCELTLTGHLDYVLCVTNLPDGRIISGSADKTIKIWDTTTGHCDFTLEGHTHDVNSIAVCPDGKIVSASLDGSIRLWS